MKNLEYQQKAVSELIDKTIRLLNLGEQRNKLVFEATTGAGKTVMACQMLAGLMDELQQQRRKPLSGSGFYLVRSTQTALAELQEVERGI